MRASKYFEEYEVEETIRPNGKKKRVYVYHGDLYTRLVTPRRRKLERAAYVVMSMAAAILLLFAMLRGVAPNHSGVIAMLSILAIIPAFLAIMGAWIGLFDREKISRTDYNERAFLLKIMPLVAAALTVAMAIGYGIYAYRAVDTLERGEETLASVLSFAAALLYAGIGIMELSVRYSVEKGSKSISAPERHFHFKENRK